MRRNVEIPFVFFSDRLFFSDRFCPWLVTIMRGVFMADMDYRVIVRKWIRLLLLCFKMLLLCLKGWKQDQDQNALKPDKGRIPWKYADLEALRTAQPLGNSQP